MGQARIVDGPTEFPGICMISGSCEGPMLQTGLLTQQIQGGGTQYVRLDHLIALAEQVGCWGPHKVAAAQGQLDRMPALDLALTALRLEHDRLIEAVGYTLKNGAVARKGEVVLRTPPGKPKVAL